MQTPVRALLFAIVTLLSTIGSPVAEGAGAGGQDSLTVNVLRGDGTEEVRTIPVPFVEKDLWNEAIRRMLEKDYWGSNRAYVRMSPTSPPILCRVVGRQFLQDWFQEFKADSESDSIWKQNEIQYQAFVSEVFAVSLPSQMTFGSCGTGQSPLNVVAVGGVPASFFWMDAIGEMPARLCSLDNMAIGSGSFSIWCVEVSENPRLLRNFWVVDFRSDLQGAPTEIVEINVDTDEILDVCAVNTSIAERGWVATTGPLPHPIASGSLSLPGGAEVDSGTIGFLSCRTRSPSGKLYAGTITFPLTWIGGKGMRTWADIDADGRTDFCRIVSKIGPATTSALLLCTPLQEGVYGDSFVELIELN